MLRTAWIMALTDSSNASATKLADLNGASGRNGVSTSNLHPLKAIGLIYIAQIDLMFPMSAHR